MKTARKLRKIVRAETVEYCLMAGLFLVAASIGTFSIDRDVSTIPTLIASVTVN